MTSSCEELVGKSAIQYRCRLPIGHDGPCVAPENGPSQIARGRWEAEQRSLAQIQPLVTGEPETTVPPGSVTILPGVLPSGVDLPPAYAPKHESFRGFALDMLHEEFNALPTSLRSWVLGAEAQMILSDLWMAVRDSGQVVVDRATLDRIIPESLRG